MNKLIRHKPETFRQPNGAILQQVATARRDDQSLSTRQGYDALLNHLRDFAGDGFDKRVVDEDYVGDFAEFLNARVKKSSVRGYIDRLKALVRAAKNLGLIDIMPEIDFTKLVPKDKGAEKVFLTKDELQRMCLAESPMQSTKNAFLFSCYTGLLIGEVEQLRWDSIRYSGMGPVLVRRVEGLDEMVKIPVIQPANNILKTLESEYAQLPAEQRDDRVFHLCSETAIGKHLRLWADNAHIDKKINYSTSRHTFATMALRAGIDLLVVARWCGYTKVQSAQVYADLVDRVERSDGEILEAAFR